MTVKTKRLIIAISGASGSIYGIRLLELLQQTPFETHLILTPAAKITLAHETTLKVADVTALADKTHAADDIAACISSGSYDTHGMIVAPCSMKSLGEIAHGIGNGLLPRSADVVLKERRKLVLMVRETPLTLTHTRNMVAAGEAGAIIFPPVPAFYLRPKTIEELVDHSVSRVLDLFDIKTNTTRRWGIDIGKKG